MSDDMESIDIKIEAADPDPEGPYSVVSMLPLKKCNGNHAGGLHRKVCDFLTTIPCFHAPKGLKIPSSSQDYG